MYMQVFDELNDKEQNWIPELYDIAILTDMKHDKRPIITQEGFIHKKARIHVVTKCDLQSDCLVRRLATT